MAEIQTMYLLSNKINRISHSCLWIPVVTSPLVCAERTQHLRWCYGDACIRGHHCPLIADARALCCTWAFMLYLYKFMYSIYAVPEHFCCTCTHVRLFWILVVIIMIGFIYFIIICLLPTISHYLVSLMRKFLPIKYPSYKNLKNK